MMVFFWPRGANSIVPHLQFASTVSKFKRHPFLCFQGLEVGLPAEPAPKHRPDHGVRDSGLLGRDLDSLSARAGSGGSRPASLHAPSRRALEWPSSPWTKDASLRDSSTRVDDARADDAQWKAQWLAALEKEYGGERPAQPSVSTSVLFDNTGEPVCYAV